jgi:hypothetical protein
MTTQTDNYELELPTSANSRPETDLQTLVPQEKSPAVKVSESQDACAVNEAAHGEMQVYPSGWREAVMTVAVGLCVFCMALVRFEMPALGIWKGRL